MNRVKVENAVAKAACSESSRREEAAPAIAACMALWDCVAEARHQDDERGKAVAESMELQKEVENLKVLLDQTVESSLQLLAREEERGKEWRAQAEDRNNRAEAAEARVNELGRDLEVSRAEVSRLNEFISKHITISDVTSILDQLEKLQKHSLALQTQLDAEHKTSDAIANALKLERDDAGKVFGRLGLVAKEIAGISDNAPSMECIDAIWERHKKVLAWAGRLMYVLRNRDVYPNHVTSDICDKAKGIGVISVERDPL